MYRKTISGEVCLSGRGIHTGQESTLNIRGTEKKGIFLVYNGNRYNVTEAAPEGTGRGTDLVFEDGCTFRTVEHLLASLKGLAIEDIEIELSGGTEIPALGGNSATIARALVDGGIVSNKIILKELNLNLPSGINNDAGQKAIWAFPSREPKYTFIIDFENDLIGTQTFTFIPGSMDFCSEIAPARTFGFEEEIEGLRKNGLALGGDLDNAVLVGKTSLRAKGGLVFPDEFVRHKILDLIGDLSLLGYPLNAHIYAYRSGHQLNLAFVKKLKRMLLHDGGVE